MTPKSRRWVAKQKRCWWSRTSRPCALRTIAEHPEVSLLCTDVGLPEMNGRELADAARRKRADLPVLFITGYAHDATFNQRRFDSHTGLLTKPFNRYQLGERVRSLLDA